MSEQGCFDPDNRFYQDYLFYRGKVACIEDTLTKLRKVNINMNILTQKLKANLHQIRHYRDQGVTDLIQPIGDQEHLIEQVIELFEQLEYVIDILDIEPVPYREEEDDHK